MPFTISHTAAIIPFYRKPFVLSALIVGSMSPDFLYFLPFVPNIELTHTLEGLFVFCLPASLGVLFVYHNLIKQPLVALLPLSIQSRLQRFLKAFSFLPPGVFISIVVSALLGAFTHIAWDSFTHVHGQAVLAIPLLARPVFTLMGETIHLYKLLQYLSSIIGFLLVFIWCVNLIRQEESADLSESSAEKPWLALFVLVAGFVGLLYGWRWFDAFGFRSFVVQTVIGTMSCFVGLLIVFSFYWHFRAWRESRHS